MGFTTWSFQWQNVFSVMDKKDLVLPQFFWEFFLLWINTNPGYHIENSPNYVAQEHQDYTRKFQLKYSNLYCFKIGDVQWMLVPQFGELHEKSSAEIFGDVWGRSADYLTGKQETFPRRLTLDDNYTKWWISLSTRKGRRCLGNI